MKIKNIVIPLILFWVVISTAHSDSVIGKIQMIEPYVPQGLVYFQLKNHPSLDGGGCPHVFFVAQMSDQNFKSFLYPVLLAAKTTDSDIKVIVDGCSGPYPLVVGAEYSPRQ